MDALNGFMMQYQPGSADSLTIEIPQEEMSSLLAHFFAGSLRCKGGFWTQGLVHHRRGHHPQRSHRLFCQRQSAETVAAACAAGAAGRSGQHCHRPVWTRIPCGEFGQLSRSVNRMLDGLAQSFELQRQFAGNAAHELRTPRWPFCRQSWNCLQRSIRPWTPKLPG